MPFTDAVTEAHIGKNNLSKVSQVLTLGSRAGFWPQSPLSSPWPCAHPGEQGRSGPRLYGEEEGQQPSLLGAPLGLGQGLCKGHLGSLKPAFWS